MKYKHFNAHYTNKAIQRSIEKSHMPASPLWKPDQALIVIQGNQHVKLGMRLKFIRHRGFGKSLCQTEDGSTITVDNRIMKSLL